MVQGLLLKRKENTNKKKGRLSIAKYKRLKKSCTPQERVKRDIRTKIEDHLREKSKRV